MLKMLAVVNRCEQRRIRAVNKLRTTANNCEQPANHCEQPANNLQTTANKRSANKVTKVYTKFFCSYLMTSIRKMSYV